ncbi:MAG: hypothetical protein ABJA74_01340 [Lapillicoccus sp.]
MPTVTPGDLGFVVDLVGWTGAADPLSGLPAKAVTRGYHLFSSRANRGRTALSRLTEAVFGRQGVQLGLVLGSDVPLDTDTPLGACARRADRSAHRRVSPRSTSKS